MCPEIALVFYLWITGLHELTGEEDLREEGEREKEGIREKRELVRMCDAAEKGRQVLKGGFGASEVDPTGIICVIPVRHMKVSINIFRSKSDQIMFLE